MSGLSMATADEEAAADHRPTQQTGEEYGSTRAKDQRSAPRPLSLSKVPSFSRKDPCYRRFAITLRQWSPTSPNP